MKVSVIIPALNEEDRIASAARSAWDAGADEVIVVDGGSTDRTTAIAHELACDVVESRTGRAIQQNVGAARASGDVFVFLHADNRLGPHAIEQVRELFQNRAAQCGAFKQQIAAAGYAFRFVERGNAWRVRWRGLPYGDQAMFLRREFFDSLGNFPDVKLMEDLLLMKKARRLSWPRLLEGPVHVDARRWQQQGIIRQTLRNWMLIAAYQFGCSPDSLAAYYRRHDAT